MTILLDVDPQKVAHALSKRVFTRIPIVERSKRRSERLQLAGSQLPSVPNGVPNASNWRVPNCRAFQTAFRTPPIGGFSIIERSEAASVLKWRDLTPADSLSICYVENVVSELFSAPGAPWPFWRLRNASRGPDWRVLNCRAFQTAFYVHPNSDRYSDRCS